MRSSHAAVCFVLSCVFLLQPALSQTAVQSVGGTVGDIPVFADSSTITSSAVSVSNSFVGIGYPVPLATLHLLQNLFVSPAGNYHGDAPVHINGGQGNFGRLTELDGSWWNGQAFNIMSSTDSNAARHYWAWGLKSNEWFVAAGYWAQDGPPIAISTSGSMGVGTDAPRAAIEIALPNDGMLLSSPNSTLTFPDGTAQTTAWNGRVPGGDYAESIQVVGPRSDYEPGEVMAFDTAQEGHCTKTTQAYSRLVAGVVSTKPGLTGRRLSIQGRPESDQLPLALVGIVPVKVTAESGPIEVGDLLVSSSMPGYAMKGADPSRLRGAILGKALSSLDSGSGTIETLLLVK